MGISEAVVQSVSSTSLGVIFICLSLIWNILSSLSTRTAGRVLKTEQLEAGLFSPFFPVQSLQTFADFLALLVFCPPCNILPYYVYLGICISMNQEELLVDNELHRSA